MRADCIAAGSSGLARAQAMLTGKTYSCSQRNDRRRAWRDVPCARSLQLRQKQKGVITDHLGRNHRSGRPVARSHCAGSTNGGTSWLASAGVQCAVCTLCRCTRPEGQSPDLTSSTHREVQLTRSAAHARAAGQRLRRAADPSAVPGRRAAAGAHDVWHGRVRARSTWLAGRRERRERERGARAVRSRRGARAAPTRPRQLALDGGRAAPRRLVPASLSRREPPGGLADRGRARSAARKTNQAHGPRTGRAMRRERRAADAPRGRFVFSKRPRRAPAAAPSGGARARGERASARARGRPAARAARLRRAGGRARAGGGGRRGAKQ